MAVEYYIDYLGFIILKYMGDSTAYVQSFPKIPFKNIEEALSYVKQEYTRLKHKRLNRKTRNEAKLLAREWNKRFKKGKSE